jgi:hypothetical protein
MAVNVSLKRAQITKANTTMVVATAIAAFALTFTVIAGRALLNKRAYQSRVITAKQKAVDQLQANIKATNSLVTSYKAFVGTPENVIGGNPNGKSDHDGDNAKIVLDALPSQYDFPALASSLEKIITTNNYKTSSISGTDDEIAQENATTSGDPAAVAMPFQIAATTDLTGAKGLSSILERSIRPIQVQSLGISGTNAQLQVSVKAQTFYLPGKTLNIQTKVVQ